jgi:hypothetical protein
VIRPPVLLEHTDAVIGAVHRYHSALAHMMAAEHTIREVVDNALVAGVSPGAVRGIINSFADAADTPLLFASDVDPRLTDPDEEPPPFLSDTMLDDLIAPRTDRRPGA